jgi:DNA-binding response OmpR family regulator
MDNPDTETRRTILVAEDDDMVRTLAARNLERAGYHVLEAGSGHDAAVVSSLYDGPIDLLIADAVLPGMTGAALAEMMLKQRPQIRTLFMSGYAENARVPDWALEQGLMLAKPFAMAELVARADALLSGDPPAQPPTS